MSRAIPQLLATFDLETFGGLDPTWGRLIVGVVKPWKEEPIVFRVNRVKSDDSKIVADVINELKKYAIIAAHNGLYFDVQFLNGRALEYNIPPIPPEKKLIDPCQVARKHLGMRRNSLDAIAAHMHLDEQKMHVPAEVWVKAGMDNDKEALNILVERCVSDVRVLECLTERMLPLMRNITPWGSA